MACIITAVQPLHIHSLQDDSSTLFLIAGYARYNCPYVWVSSVYTNDYYTRLRLSVLKSELLLSFRFGRIMNDWLDWVVKTRPRKTFPFSSNPLQTGRKQVKWAISNSNHWRSHVSICWAEAKVWDVIAELVHICTSPSPPNPFAVDIEYFEALSVRERVLATAAMINLLRSVLASGSHRYDRRGIEKWQTFSSLSLSVLMSIFFHFI